MHGCAWPKFGRCFFPLSIRNSILIRFFELWSWRRAKSKYHRQECLFCQKRARLFCQSIRFVQKGFVCFWNRRNFLAQTELFCKTNKTFTHNARYNLPARCQRSPCFVTGSRPFVCQKNLLYAEKVVVFCKNLWDNLVPHKIVSGILCFSTLEDAFDCARVLL